MSVILISQNDIDRCSTFAKNVLDSTASNIMKRSGGVQRDLFKIESDHKNGKIGELIAYKEIVKKYPNLTPPDFEIYSTKQKTWDADLKDRDSGLKVAVKTFNYKNYPEASWVFELSDKAIFSDNIDDDNYYVCFVSIHSSDKAAKIQAIVKLKWLHDQKLFKELRNKKLINKRSVYNRDLKRYSQEELFQL